MQQLCLSSRHNERNERQGLRPELGCPRSPVGRPGSPGCTGAWAGWGGGGAGWHEAPHAWETGSGPALQQRPRVLGSNARPQTRTSGKVRCGWSLGPGEQSLPGHCGVRPGACEGTQRGAPFLPGQSLKSVRVWGGLHGALRGPHWANTACALGKENCAENPGMPPVHELKQGPRGRCRATRCPPPLPRATRVTGVLLPSPPQRL